MGNRWRCSLDHNGKQCVFIFFHFFNLSQNIVPISLCCIFSQLCTHRSQYENKLSIEQQWEHFSPNSVTNSYTFRSCKSHLLNQSIILNQFLELFVKRLLESEREKAFKQWSKTQRLYLQALPLFTCWHDSTLGHL